MKFGFVGDNLLNDDVRFAQSFKKGEVLQPGRTVKVFDVEVLAIKSHASTLPKTLVASACDTRDVAPLSETINRPHRFWDGLSTT